MEQQQQAISSDLIRGHIDTIILYSLLDSDKFAQQISDSVEEKSNGDYKLNQATLYSSLKRLENLKYVSSYWFDANTGRRKYFKISENGKNVVKSNLDNWSYSRALIDKLVDCEPAPIIKTQYVEKIVEVPIEVPVQVAVSPTLITDNKKLDSAVDIQKENIIEEKPVEKQEFSEKNTSEQEKVEECVKESTTQEINFRNILNGLIKASRPVKKQVVEQHEKLEPIEKITEEKPVEKLKFNETITNVDYNAQKVHHSGKLDFGDLVLKAAKEGYKIRISSKDSSVPTGKLLINKLNFCSAIFTYLFVIIEFLLVALLANDVLKLNAVSIGISAGVLTLFPMILAIIYLNSPNKRTNKLVYADSILTVAIIVFNLLLITFAANLIFGTNFNDLFSILVYMAIPAILYVDALIYFSIKYLFAKLKPFTVKIKEK